MAEDPRQGGQSGEGQFAQKPHRLVLAGRLGKRERGMYQIELIDGLTVDVAEEDCERVEESTDAVTLRSMVAVTLKGDKPITATFQPHLYRVLAQAGAVPFPFGGAADVPPDQFDLPSIAMAGPTGPGGGGGGGGIFQPSIKETGTRSRSWIAGWITDDNRIDTTDDSIF